MDTFQTMQPSIQIQNSTNNANSSKIHLSAVAMSALLSQAALTFTFADIAHNERERERE